MKMTPPMKLEKNTMKMRRRKNLTLKFFEKNQKRGGTKRKF